MKFTFCCKFWIYSLRMTMFGWLWWYMWPRMANKMSEEFPTIYLNITCFGTSTSSRRRPTRNSSKKYKLVSWMKYETTAKTLFERQRKLKQTESGCWVISLMKRQKRTHKKPRVCKFLCQQHCTNPHYANLWTPQRSVCQYPSLAVC